MFKVSTCIILVIILFSTCSKEIVDIPDWLKDKIGTYKECHCNPGIYQYLWNDKTLYVLTFNAPNCDTMPTIYDENGVEIELPPNIQFHEFIKEAEFIKNVWTCKVEI